MTKEHVPDGVRQAVIYRDHFKCKLCRLAFPATYPFAVIPASPHKQQLEPDNLITVCLRCEALSLEERNTHES